VTPHLDGRSKSFRASKFAYFGFRGSRACIKATNVVAGQDVFVCRHSSAELSPAFGDSPVYKWIPLRHWHLGKPCAIGRRWRQIATGLAVTFASCSVARSATLVVHSSAVVNGLSGSWQWVCPYADDAVIHCKSDVQAQFVLRRIDERFRECGLELHPSKTRIVYCKDMRLHAR
jgi:Reverse transcriptase (RNA-dependent DNA polymerase)